MSLFESKMQQQYSAPATVNELCDRYETWAEGYYRQTTETGNREPTREHLNMRDALRALRIVAGEKPPETLVAEDLCACQAWLLEQRKPNGDPLSRNVINKRINRIRRAIRWATKPPHRWIPVHVLTDMQLVDPLDRDRTDARETERVTGAPWEHIKAMLEALAEESLQSSRASWALTLATMIETHWHSGMRPGELVRMRMQDLAIESPKLNLLEEAVEIMIYRPFRHKTKHHGLDRNIFLSPEARRLVEDQMRRVKDAGGRLWPYTTNSYREAIVRYQRKHNLPRWSPNQIRHSFATRMREVAGIDVVQVLMGHRHRSTTEIYARPDATAAIAAILRHG